MYKKVRAFMEENQMILPGDWVIAGVSGGGDSMAMLSMLKRYAAEKGFALEAVHVNHGIRGEEAKRDQRLVEEICREREIPLQVYCFDVPKLSAEWKMGHEEAGRLARSRAFAQAAAKSRESGGRVRLALAHNQNDAAETMLHNLSRGTGLRGLAGIRPVNGDTIRPVLCLKREEIDHYLKENHIPYVTDSSNLEDDYTRNRIRHHILPCMEREINGETVAHMAETAGMIREADDYLTKRGEELLMRRALEDGSFLLTEEFFEEEPIIQSYAVLAAFERLGGGRKDIGAVHVRQVLALNTRQTGKRLTLPGGVCAGKEYGGVRIRKKNAKEEPAKYGETQWELPAPGTLMCPLGAFSAEIFSYFGQKISEKKYTKWLDYDKIKDNLSIRTRRAGDTLAIGKDRRKKVSRCMIDDKIPIEQRERIPLLVCGEEVLWMVGGRISEKYKISRSTERVLEVSYQGGYQDE